MAKGTVQRSRSASRPGRARRVSTRPKATRGKSAARRTPLRAGRGRAGAAATPSELQSLKDNLTAIEGKVAALGKPVHGLSDLITKVKAPLALPQTIMRRLDDTTTAMKGLRLLATALSWVPGPIGTGAKAADKALKPFVAKPPAPKGYLGNARDIVADIDKTLKPARDAIEKIEKPVGKGVTATDAIDGKIVSLIAMADRLIAHYGAAPPAGIEACAKKLNGPLTVFLAQIEKAEAELGKGLATLNALLGALLAALTPLLDVAARLQKALGVFDSKAFRAVWSQVAKLVNALEPYRRKAAIILKAVIGKILKKIGIDARKVEKFFNGIVASINPLKPIQAVLAKLKAQLAAQVAKLIAAAGIAEKLAQLEALQKRLEKLLGTFLDGECRKVLMPEKLG
jgi:hypothetical protein